MSNHLHTLGLIAVVALVTAGLRFLPFLLFRKKTPPAVLYLGRVLPCAIMAMLLVYCLRNVSPVSGTRGIPEAASIAAVALLHKWRHNTLLSILGGTVLYMSLLRLFF